MSGKDRRPPNRHGGAKLGQFFALPYDHFRTPEFAALSARAVKLLIELCLQYSGSNNGDLTATFSVMRRRGFTSADQLRKARDELINAGWIMVTRQGGRHAPSLYALTFRDVDHCKGKIDIRPGPAMHLWKPANAHRRENKAPISKSTRKVCAKLVDRDTDHIGPRHGTELDRVTDQQIQN